MALPLTTGIICGQTAFKIYDIICNHEDGYNTIDFKLKEFHVKLDPMTFNNIRDGYFNHKYKIKRVSNCKLQATTKKQNYFDDTIRYFLYKDMLGTIIKYVLLNLKINSTLQKIKIEDITSVQINTLLSPLINLRKCSDLNEALMNWSLNNNFMEFPTYIKHQQLLSSNGDDSIINHTNLIENISWFLGYENIINFVPKKFIRKVYFLHKKTNQNTVKLFNEFMDIICLINKHFIIMVKKYYKNEKVSQITSFNLNFPIELYGNKEDIMDPNKRKSLFLVRKNNDYLHLKSFAILFNLRWFFNTRYNSKKALGFDGEYGRTMNGYGQTFHKYDDVILWLITHPNTIEDVEFVVLDPIPVNYIFNKKIIK
jgi:hypothetical protein